VSVYEKRGLEVLGNKQPRTPKELVGGDDTERSSQALPYSPELANLLGLQAHDDDDIDDVELEDEDDE
jgi:hypothetical protein